MAPMLLLLGLVLSTSAAGHGPSANLGPNEREADVLYARSLGRLELDDFEDRQEGLRDLEEAVRLAPANPEYRLSLAHAYFTGGYFHAARQGFEQLARADSASAYLDLGLLWRHDWLESRDPKSLDRAVDALVAAAWLSPLDADAWLVLVPLYLAKSRPDEAASAAYGALMADSKRLEAHLAVGATLGYLGAVGLSDSIFRATIPRLPSELRARYESAAPLPPGPPSASETLVAGSGADAGELSAAAVDRIESWSGLTELYVLLPVPGANGGEEQVDLRARFQSPGMTQESPVGRRLRWGSERVAGETPPDAVWEYPDLGVRIMIRDHLLALRPDLSISRATDAAALPISALMATYARVMAALGGSQPARGGLNAGARETSTR